MALQRFFVIAISVCVLSFSQNANAQSTSVDNMNRIGEQAIEFFQQLSPEQKKAAMEQAKALMTQFQEMSPSDRAELKKMLKELSSVVSEQMEKIDPKAIELPKDTIDLEKQMEMMKNLITNSN